MIFLAITQLIIFLFLMNTSTLLLPFVEADAKRIGKTLTQPERNLIAKLESFGVSLPLPNSDGSPFHRSNPFGGGCDVTQTAAAIYDFVMESYRNYSRDYSFSFRGHKFPISIYDRTRYLFLKLWPDEYSALLD